MLWIVHVWLFENKTEVENMFKLIEYPSQEHDPEFPEENIELKTEELI